MLLARATAIPKLPDFAERKLAGFRAVVTVENRGTRSLRDAAAGSWRRGSRCWRRPLATPSTVVSDQRLGLAVLRRRGNPIELSNLPRVRIVVAFLVAAVLAGPVTKTPVGAAPACSPTIAQAMDLVRTFKREHDAYVEQRESTLARAAWSNLVHQVILARQEGGNDIYDCHDGLAVATFNLANLWILRGDAPELTHQQALAASARAEAEFKPKITAMIDDMLAKLDNKRKPTKPTPRPTAFPTLTPLEPTPSPDPEEVAQQPKVAAFLRDERRWLVQAFQRGADRYWRAEYIKAKADVIDDYADRGVVFVPYEKTTPQFGP